MTEIERNDTKSTQAPTKTDGPAPAPDEIIAHRRTCDATGTGLTHFILVDEKRK